MTTDDRFTRTELEQIARALELAEIVGHAAASTRPGYATAAGMLRRKVQAMAADTEVTDEEREERRRHVLTVHEAAWEKERRLELQRRAERAHAAEIERVRRIGKDTTGGDDDAAT